MDKKLAERSSEGEAMSLKMEAERAYGCIFCVTGKELAVANHIERACEDTRTIIARQLKRRITQGKPHLEEKVLYPGYAFFEAPALEEVIQGLPKDERILSILKSPSGDWRLYGNDAKLVEWLFSYDGLLPISQAIKEGDWVRIIGGPLFDLLGSVKRFDKHHKCAEVAITFCNREVKTWLQYDLLEKKE